MLFTVTYRAKDGALREERIEAASRAECVAECRRRGISGITGISGKSGTSGISGASGRSGISGASGRSGTFGKLRLAIGAALAIAIAGGAWWWFGRDEEKPKIASVQPQVAKKPRMETPQTRKSVEVPAQGQGAVAATNKVDTAAAKKDRGEYVDERGIRRTANGLRIRTGEPARKIKLGYEAHRRFKNMCDEHIAGLLEIVPGRMVFGRMEFGKKFVEDFKASLNDKIEILDTDSEYDKQLKRDVIATREELEAAMQRGEDIGKLLTDARNQLQEIGRYREELKKRFYEYRKEGTHSVEELQDFVKAANVMLEEQGAKPIRLSSLLLRNLKQQQGESK